MAVRLNPYLRFRDDAREALEFYQSVLRRPAGPEHVRRAADVSEGPAEQDKIMHGMLETEDGRPVDRRPGAPPSPVRYMAAEHRAEHPRGRRSRSACSTGGPPRRRYWAAG